MVTSQNRIRFCENMNAGSEIQSCPVRLRRKTPSRTSFCNHSPSRANRANTVAGVSHLLVPDLRREIVMNVARAKVV